MILNENIIKQYKKITLSIFVKMSFISKELQLRWERRDFNNWLNTEIEHDKKISDIIYEILGDISNLLDNNNYEIKNKKQFKDELASYIYTDSIKYE